MPRRRWPASGKLHRDCKCLFFRYSGMRALEHCMRCCELEVAKTSISRASGSDHRKWYIYLHLDSAVSFAFTGVTLSL